MISWPNNIMAPIAGRTQKNYKNLSWEGGGERSGAVG